MAIDNNSNELREILLDLAVEVVAPQRVIDSIRKLNVQELRVAADFMLAGLQVNHGAQEADGLVSKTNKVDSIGESAKCGLLPIHRILEAGS